MLTAFGQSAVDFVNGMSVADILTLPLDGVVASLIQASAMVTVCSWNGQIGRLSRPALDDLRAVAEAHCRMGLRNAPAIATLFSTLDVFRDALLSSVPHGAPNEGLPQAAEPNMEVAMHLMTIAQTAEQRRGIYNQAVQLTLRNNASLLMEITPEMYANMPPVVLGLEGVQAERALLLEHYAGARGVVTAALDALAGMQLTRYRYREVLDELVSRVLLVLVRALNNRLATAYHQGHISMPHVTELVQEMIHQHLQLFGLVRDRLCGLCSDENVFIKYTAAPIMDAATFNGAAFEACMQEARATADEVHEVYQLELGAAFAAGPVVHQMAAAQVLDDGPPQAPVNVEALVDVVMEQATMVQFLDVEEECAACLLPVNTMVLCHGCQHCHCCVACTRIIVQSNPFNHRCPVCRSRAFPVPSPAVQWQQ